MVLKPDAPVTITFNLESCNRTIMVLKLENMLLDHEFSETLQSNHYGIET